MVSKVYWTTQGQKYELSSLLGLTYWPRRAAGVVPTAALSSWSLLPRGAPFDGLLWEEGCSWMNSPLKPLLGPGRENNVEETELKDDFTRTTQQWGRLLWSDMNPWTLGVILEWLEGKDGGAGTLSVVGERQCPTAEESLACLGLADCGPLLGIVLVNHPVVQQLGPLALHTPNTHTHTHSSSECHSNVH